MSPQLMAISTGNEWWVHWLVVYLPLWRIWKSVGTMKFPIYGKIQNVPNHQPVKIGMYGSKPEYHWQALVTARSNPSILGINNLIHIVTIVSGVIVVHLLGFMNENIGLVISIFGYPTFDPTCLARTTN